MKMFGIFLICTSCAIMGLFIDKCQKARLKELEGWIFAFELLRSEIDYRLSPLREAAAYVADFTIDSIRAVMEHFSKRLDEKQSVDLYGMWKEAVDNNRGRFHLNDEDYKVLYEFGSNYQDTDKSMQKKNLELIIEKLKYTLQLGQKKYDKTSKLNKYLGVLVGICISIFLV